MAHPASDLVEQALRAARIAGYGDYVTCDLIFEYLEAAGYQVVRPAPEAVALGAIVNDAIEYLGRLAADLKELR